MGDKLLRQPIIPAGLPKPATLKDHGLSTGVSNCLEKSSWLMSCNSPGRPILEDRVEDGEELAHARRQRQLLGLACPTEALIEGANQGQLGSGLALTHHAMLFSLSASRISSQCNLRESIVVSPVG
jgi:hypothetical protein